jgi:ABC-type transport system involved in cytochrome bd biosynthesis fused ATPase/permease subunit
MQALRDAMAGRTVLIVSHRAAVLGATDRVVRLAAEPTALLGVA